MQRGDTQRIDKLTEVGSTLAEFENETTPEYRAKKIARALAWFKTILGISGSAVVSVVLGFFSKDAWRLFFEKTALTGLGFSIAFILLPLLLLIDYVKTGLALYDAITATSENRFKSILHFLIEFGRAALSTVAVLGVLGAITLPLLLGPILFVAAVGLGVVFNGYALLDQLLNPSKIPGLLDAEAQEVNAMKRQKFALQFVISLLVGVGIGVMLLSGVGAAVLLGVGIATAAIVLVGGIAAILYGRYVDNKVGNIQSSTAAIENMFDDADLGSILAPVIAQTKSTQASELDLLDDAQVRATPTTSTSIWSCLFACFCGSSSGVDEAPGLDPILTKRELLIG